jgi:hypothetical protein
MSGACFGFSPISSLPFEYLRAGDGEPLEIQECEESEEDGDDGSLVKEWTPIPGRRSWARLYHENGLYRLWIEGGGTFVVDPTTPRVGVPAGLEAPVRREERLWGIPALLCFLARGDLPLHAAAVDIGGEAVLLAAPGYHGKTTLAAAFDARGYRVLSEDVSCIRLSSPPTLVPGPAMLRVRGDVAAKIVLPGAREVAAGDDRVHFSLDRKRRGDCTPVRLRALILLRPSENGLALERVSAGDALRDLWPLSFRLPSLEDRTRCFEGITALADTVRVWNLRRPLRIYELDDVVRRIVADA